MPSASGILSSGYRSRARDREDRILDERCAVDSVRVFILLKQVGSRQQEKEPGWERHSHQPEAIAVRHSCRLSFDTRIGASPDTTVGPAYSDSTTGEFWREPTPQRDRAIRLEQVIGRELRPIALLAREHPHVPMREHQLYVELRSQPRDDSAALPSWNVVLSVSRPQPSMVAIDRSRAGYELHAPGERDRRERG
jgi:hypothetical protein